MVKAARSLSILVVSFCYKRYRAGSTDRRSWWSWSATKRLRSRRGTARSKSGRCYRTPVPYRSPCKDSWSCTPPLGLLWMALRCCNKINVQGLYILSIRFRSFALGAKGKLDSWVFVRRSGVTSYTFVVVATLPILHCSRYSTWRTVYCGR